MIRRVLFIVWLAAALMAAPVFAKGSKGGSHSHRSADAKSSGTHTSRKSTASAGVARDSHGRIKRSEEAKHDFMRQTGYPHGRPGYVVDHIKPLACGGADAPSNMQWQTVAESRAKDKVERLGCR